MRAPAALAAVPLLVGSVAGLLSIDAVPVGWALPSGAGAALALLSAAASVEARCAPEATIALVLCAALAGFSLGSSGARQAYAEPPPSFDDGPVMLEGRLREDAAVTASGVSFTLTIARAAPAGGEPGPVDRPFGARVSVAGTGALAAVPAWRAGRAVRLTATLRPPSTYRNFGVPDDGRALARRGIARVGSAKSAALVEVAQEGTAWDEAAGAVRAWTRARLGQHVGPFSARSAGIATAILVGDRTGLSDVDERRLQDAGTYHVIAISGGNIAILAALILLGLRAARVPGRPAAAIAVVALIFYGQVTGAPPSVARAVTAAAVYLAARAIDHRGPALNAVAVAAGWAIAGAPVIALDPGFVLSFGATLGILLGVPRLVPGSAARAPRRSALRRFALAAAALTGATVCAEAALLPVSAVYFARVTFAGLVLNVAAIPLMSIVQGASMLTLAASTVSARAADACGYAVHLAAAGLVESSRLVDVAPWFFFDVLPPAWWLVAAYYAGCVGILCGRRVRHAATALAVSAAVLIVASPHFARRGETAHRKGILRVVFLDVGQGDATLVQLHDGRSVLVDAAGLPGSALDVGERIVAPALRAFGVRRLHALLLTHGDPDHVGGAPGVLRRFRPGAVWEGVPVPPHPALRELAETAASAGATWRNVQSGDVERIAGADLRVWHPPPPDWERQRVRNDDSIVLEVRLDDVSILLPGDIGREPERALAAHLSLAPLVVLKAPHHGSATSSSDDFVAAVKPAAVIFSAGRRNPFNHPHPTVVSRYRAAGAAILSTADDGAVIVETDGREVHVRTRTGRRLSLRP